MTLPASPDAAAVQAEVPAVNPPGLRNAFRLLIEHFGDHADLLRLEAGEELSRLGSVIGWWFALALLVQMSLALGVVLLVAAQWDTGYRLHAVLGLALSLAVIAGFCMWQLKRLGARAASRFDHSSRQLKRDLALIRELI